MLALTGYPVTAQYLSAPFNSLGSKSVDIFYTPIVVPPSEFY